MFFSSSSNSRRLYKRRCAISTRTVPTERTSVPADVGISALFDTRAGQIDKSNPILVLCVRRDRSSRRPSTLNGSLSHPARSKAPPADEKTEKSKGTFAPNASAIANPNAIRRIPLNRAAVCVCQPTRRRSPKRISAPVEMTASVVEMTASVRVILGGKYELSRPYIPRSVNNSPKLHLVVQIAPIGRTCLPPQEEMRGQARTAKTPS
jgi:hypothetical protein